MRSVAVDVRTPNPENTSFVSATRARRGSPSDRLLVIDPQSRSFRDASIRQLERFLISGDVVVLNDAATLPASLSGRSNRGRAIELRLCGGGKDGQFQAVLFGEGDWRIPTERRAPPESLGPGDRIQFDDSFWAIVDVVEPLSPRLVRVRFNLEGSAFWRALYVHGNPVQYSYMTEPIALWSVQNCYACRPMAAERPSAGRPLTIATLIALSRRGVDVAAITHAAGLSSTGDPLIDAALPLPEWFEIPEQTVEKVERARARGGRIVAVGTTVVRALEGGVARHGRLVPTREETDLVITPEHKLKVVDGLLTGLHEPTASHHHLMSAFVSAALLSDAYEHARTIGYLGHEFGDVSLILSGSLIEEKT
jgi:S-adenosylmethionine:tRNA ribosyltransferase-isomerase